MVQQLDINTDTLYSTDIATDEALTITLQASGVTPNTVKANLNLNLKQNHINNVKCMPGELLLVLKNTLKSISFEIDPNGNLIINGPDANNYSLDANGNLIYTYR